MSRRCAEGWCGDAAEVAGDPATFAGWVRDERAVRLLRDATRALLVDPMSVTHAWDARTHVGLVRANNEDCFVADPDRGLFVVCDGIGGHARGEVASSTACATIRDRIAASPPSPHARTARDRLVAAIRAANRAVHALGSGDQRPGTTVAAILWARERFVVAHVGDSRVYRLRRGALVQLTRDHTVAAQLVDRGHLRPEEVATFPRRHVLTRAVGTQSDVEITVQMALAAPADVFLLASDGLQVLSADDIRGCLQEPPAVAVDRLIARSLAAGAPDNVTVIVARVGHADRSPRRRFG